MGRVDEPMDLVCVAIAVAVVASAVASWIWVKRRAKRYSPEGALADAFADSEGRFVLELPAGGPIDLYVHYSMQAGRRSGGGISYGLVMRLDVAREPSEAGYRGGTAMFEAANEYLLGQAQRPFGEVPLGEPLDAGPLMRSGLDVTRGVRLLRVPAGGRLVAKGRVQTTGLTTDFSFLLFAKPPR